MKKFFVGIILSLLLIFSFSKDANAVACCPTAGGGYQYVYNPATNKCDITGPQGTVSVDSNCTSGQVCQSGQCTNYEEPDTPTGCNTSPSTGPFCISVSYGYDVYCSTTAECNSYKENYYEDNPTAPPSAPVWGGTQADILCDGENSINTAIGCIPIGDTNSFIAFVLKWAIGIGGGIAFLLILFGGFQVMTSSGNPEKIQAGKELITSAVMGLVMLIFSIFILKFVGIDILGLGGFGITGN